MANEIFKKAVFEAYRLDMLELPDEDELINGYVFSERFKNKIKELKIYTKHRYFNINGIIVRRATAIVLSCLFILAISLGVEGIRTPIINFIVEIYEKYSFIKFKINEENIIPKNIEEFYVPIYIPTGFKFIEESNLDNVREVVYSDISGNLLVFEQYTIEGVNINIDTEGVDTKLIDINGSEGIMYTNKDVTTIVWNNDKYGFSIYGKLKEEMLFKIAKSIKIIKNF